jgi:hypothetical protein
VLTLHGAQFKDAALIVGSSPCQEFSYRAMPWSRARSLPPPYLGMKLFEAQFRIQREAIEAGCKRQNLSVDSPTLKTRGLMSAKAKRKTKPKKRAVLPLKKIKRKRVVTRTIQTERNVMDEPRADFAPETERKLSAKIIVGKRIGQVTEPKDLFTVIGIATGIRIGQSNYGEWTGLKGEFEVVRCEDGKVLQAPIMILPDAAMFELAGEGRPLAQRFPFEFALIVAVEPSTNDAGFEYRVRSVVHSRPHDALSVLRLHMNGRASSSSAGEVGSGG